MVGAGGHHVDAVARLEAAVDHTDVGDHAAVGVVDGVEDHRAAGSLGVSLRGREGADHMIQQVLDTDAGLAGDAQHVVGVDPDELTDLRCVLLGVGAWQVDLVQHRDDGEVVLHRQVQVRERLRFDALCGVDQQDRAFTGGERAGHLVGEVDVTGGVDHVQRVVHAIDLPGHAHGLALHGDAALALDVHAIEVLGAHRAVLDDPGDLQHPIGQRGLAVVDVGDDAEVAEPLLGRGRGKDVPCLVGSDPRGHRLWSSRRWHAGTAVPVSVNSLTRTGSSPAPGRRAGRTSHPLPNGCSACAGQFAGWK